MKVHLKIIVSIFTIILVGGNCFGASFNGIEREGKYEGDKPDIGAFEYFVDNPLMTASISSYQVHWTGGHYTQDYFVVYWGDKPGEHDSDSGVVYDTNYAINDARAHLYVVVRAFDINHKPSELSNEVELEKGYNPQDSYFISWKK